MMSRLARCTILVLAGTMALPLAAAAQAVDFGDDSSIWAMDGECDDPRFVGEGMAPGPLETNIMADATDCAAAFEAGTVTLDPAVAGTQAPARPAAKPGTAPATAMGGIDFGTDASPWANDGECDDPRFAGEGMSAMPQEADTMADASDCRALYDAGSIDFTAAGAGEPAVTVAAGVDFGDDSSPWAMDGTCDDPRFEGDGMASVLQDSDTFGDATDCRTLFEAGAVRLAGEPAVAPDDTGLAEGGGAEVDFGADSGQWANDGECDDPRFEGEGMADILVDDDIRADATDCRTLYEEGLIEFIGDGANATAIDFGTDSGKWAGDGECDDPRFTGPGMAAAPLDALRYLDASDCAGLYETGQITYRGE